MGTGVAGIVTDDGGEDKRNPFVWKAIRFYQVKWCVKMTVIPELLVLGVWISGDTS